MTAKWVKEDGFPHIDENRAKNDFLAALTTEQKEVLAQMLQEEHRLGFMIPLHTSMK